MLVKFITGDGGVGKTRLAARIATTLDERGWAAGFVNLRDPSAFKLKRAGTLLIVDYPEVYRDSVSELLLDLAGLNLDHKVRVLFLSRQGQEQWETTLQDGRVTVIHDPAQIELGGLEPTPAHKAFSSAQQVAAHVYGTNPVPVSEDAIEAWIKAEPENQCALFITALAVHSALHPEDEVVRYRGREVVDALADRELSRLRQVAKGHKLDDEWAFAKLAAVAAVRKTLSIQQIKDLMKGDDLNLGLPKDRDIETLLAKACMLTDRAIRAPEPDIVAAAMVVKTLSQRPEQSPELLWAALEPDLERGMQNLIRLCYDAENVLQIHSHRISDWLAEAVDGDAQRCAAFLDLFTEPPIPDSCRSACVAGCRTLLKGELDDERRAPLLNNLSTYLDAVGDPSGALEAIKEAVEIYRRLSSSNPARYEPDLAVSLNNLSTYLDAVGDPSGVLEAIKEAVEIYRRLSSSNPARYEPDLAVSLNNLSNRLDAVGDRSGGAGGDQRSGRDKTSSILVESGAL